MTLGERLCAAREAAGLTQGQLAALLKVDRNTVNRAENDHNEPLATTIGAWAVACGVTADSLLGLDAAAAPSESDDDAQTAEPEAAA